MPITQSSAVSRVAVSSAFFRDVSAVWAATVRISATAQPGNWLAVKRGRPYRLILSLLDTPTAGSNGVLEIDMPSLRKVSCP